MIKLAIFYVTLFLMIGLVAGNFAVNTAANYLTGF